MPFFYFVYIERQSSFFLTEIKEEFIEFNEFILFNDSSHPLFYFVALVKYDVMAGNFKPCINRKIEKEGNAIVTTHNMFF